MYKYIKQYLDINCKKNKRFELIKLEAFVIEKCGGQCSYYDRGGYDAFYRDMQRLKSEDIIKEIKNSDGNKAKLPMKLRWTLVKPTVESFWNNENIIRISDLLELKTYINHPEYQSDREWEYIQNIYLFLKEKGHRQWASVEERCLELFQDEKFLTDNDDGKKDNKVLKRLGLNIEDIKAKQYGEQFIYWNKGVRDIKTIIILENHSTFFSFKRIVQKGIDIFNIEPDALIFGYGKKILNSFSFIDEIADPENIKVYYFGDMDPDGYYIYVDLKKRYPNIDIKLLTEAYVELLKLCKTDYVCKKQGKKSEYLNYILEEFKKSGYDDYCEKIIKLWKEDYRIPQELITYEYLLKM